MNTEELKEIEHAFTEWLRDRPEVIKKMAEKFKPWFNYRVKSTGQHCNLYSYSEDGTVTVQINGHDNDFLDSINEMLPMGVFGVNPEDLEVIKD